MNHLPKGSSNVAEEEDRGGGPTSSMNEKVTVDVHISKKNVPTITILQRYGNL
jgi:hypothetical protein